MKKIFAIILTALGVMSLTSCVTSLQPLVTAEQITTDQRIPGKWVNDETVFTIELLPQSKLAADMQDLLGKNNKGFLFTGDPVKDSLMARSIYIVSFEKDGVKYNLAASLIKIGNQLFMDLYPALMNDTKANDDNADPFDFNNDFLPGFTIAKVSISNNNITLTFADGDFIRQQVKAGNMKLKHESDDLFDMFMITAETKELQLFIEKYANDERIFNKKSAIILTKQPVNS